MDEIRIGLPISEALARDLQATLAAQGLETVLRPVEDRLELAVAPGADPEAAITTVKLALERWLLEPGRPESVEVAYGRRVVTVTPVGRGRRAIRERNY